jgi:hypothetical protein
MLSVKHGIMIIGEPLVGKTVSYKVLINTINDLFEQELLNETKVSIFYNYSNSII